MTHTPPPSIPGAPKGPDQGIPDRPSGFEDVRPGIAAAKAPMNVTLGASRELKKLTEHLWPDEQVREMTTGTYSGGQGLVVLSDVRLMFIRKA